MLSTNVGSFFYIVECGIKCIKQRVAIKVHSYLDKKSVALTQTGCIAIFGVLTLLYK